MPPQNQTDPEVRKHSRKGVLSFIYSLLVFGLLVGMAGVVAIRLRGKLSPEETGQLAQMIGVTVFFLWLGSLIGVILGLAGLVQPESKKSLAVWGICLNGLFFLGVLIAVIVAAYFRET